MQDYEGKMNGKGYRFLKVAGDLLVLNLEFILCTALSLTILFFPSLFALVSLCKKEKESYVNPFKDFFIEMKKFMKRGLIYEAIFLPIYALCAYLLYLDYQLIQQGETAFLAWLGLVILIGFLIAITSSLIELPIFYAYFNEEKAWLGYQKAALITRKKVLLVITSWMIILTFLFIFYMFYPLVFFFGIALCCYILVSLSRSVYERLVIEEEKRKKEEQEEMSNYKS